LAGALRSFFGSARQYVDDPTHKIVLRGAVESISVRVAGVALSYAATLLLSRLLGVSDYGRYAIALSWVLVLTLPAKAGFDNSSLRYATVYLERGDGSSLRAFIRFAAGTITALSLTVALLIYLLGQQITSVEPKLLVWGALMVLPLALLTLYSVLMRTAGRVIASQFYEQMLRPSLIILAVTGLVLTGKRLDAGNALMITSLAAFGALFVLWMHFRRVFGGALRHRSDFTPWREWLAVSVPMLIMGIVQELMNHIEIILLGILTSARYAGLFAASWRLASFVPFAFVGLSTMAAPLIASAHDRGASDELFRVSALVARVGVGFAALVTLLLLLAGKWLLSLFGPGFADAYPILATLLLGGLVNAFTGIVGYLMILTGREKQSLAIFAGALVLSIVLNLLLIPRFGAVGAAVASSSATIAWNLAMLVYVRRTMGIDASALALPPRSLAGKR
jgi:O-antigen/teichoic acid export membrane protein